MLNNNKLFSKIQEIVKKRPGVSLAGVAVLVLVLWGVISLFSGGDANSSIPKYEVKEGPLKISVTESGTIQPAEKIIVKNEVEGSTAITYIVDEGSKVNAGDLLMTLDSSSLSDKKVDQEIQVQNAQASNIEASENFEVAKNQAQSDIESAKLAYDFAIQDLKKYVEGEYPDSLKQSESDITVAEQELSQAKDKLDWDKKLYKESYLSQTELNTDTLSHTQKQLGVELKKASKDLLENYTYKRNLAKLQSDVTQAKSALERTTRKAKANIAQAEANKAAKQAEYERQISKLEKYKSQLEKTKIYAPADGTVIYATSAEQSRQRFGSRTEPLKLGNSVQERQELIHLPTTKGFVVNTSIPESALDKVKVGKPAKITVDTIPNVIFSGTVTSVSNVVNAQNTFMNPDLKVYDTVITLDNDKNIDLLRSGMGCSAEIIIDQYEKATYVALQAVMSVGGKPTVYIVKGSKIKPRTVETGLDNSIVIRITSNNLKAGEIVSLSPPLAQATATDQTFEKLTDIKGSGKGANNAQTQGSDKSGSSAAPAGAGQNGNQSQPSTQGTGMPAQTGNMPNGQGGQTGAMPSGQGGVPNVQGGNMPSGQGGAMPSAADFISRMDKDGDSKVSKSEFSGPEAMFSRLDKNGDGYITKDEVPQGRPSGNQGENKSTNTRYSTTGSISDSSGDQGGGQGGGQSGGGGPGGGPGGM